MAEVLEVQIGPLTLRAEDAEAEAAGLRATLASNTKDSEGTRVALEERVLQLEAKLSERQMFYEDELQKKQLFFDDELQKKQLLLTQLSEFSQTMNSRLASADTLGTSLKSKMRGTAVGQLRAAMIRLVKGILGEVVNDWKSALHESARTKSRDAALRQLKAAMVRFVNGELSAALHNWHLALLEDSLSAAGSEASAAKSMSELGKEAMKSAAMRKLQFVFARQLKGEVYAYTLSWAQNFQEDKQGALFRSCFSALDRRSHCKSPPQLLAQIREVFMLVTQLAGGAFRTGKSQDLWSIWLMDDGAEVRNQAKLNGDIFWKLRQIVVCLKAADDETRKLGIEKNANQDEILSLREEVRTLVQCTPLLLAPGRSAENARFPIDLRWSLTLLPFSLHLMVLDWCGVTSRRALACVCRTLAGVVMIGRLGRRWKDRVYVVGADPMDPTASSTFEVLNCVTQQWGVLEPAGPMEGTAVAVREGQIYASGGFKKLELANWPVTRRVTAFNAQTAQWCIIASMIDSRANHAMSSTCGLLIVAGGRGRHGLLNSVEVLDPKDAQWTPLPPMPGEFAEREFCTAVGTERSLYVFGGSTAQGVPLDVAQVYDCVTMVWTELPPMPRPRSSCSAVQWGLCLVVAGGGHHEIDTLDLQSGEWLTLCAASSPRRFCSTLVFDDTLLLVGGLDNEGIPCDTEKYDPLNDSWTTAPGWGKFGSCLAVAC